jgi:aspartate/methionine/tyrosine aminotransferase
LKELAERGKQIERPAYRVIRDYAAQLGYKDLIYLNIGEPDFPTPQNIVKAAKKAMDKGFTHYTEERGLAELRERLALKIREEKKVEIEKDGILVTNGSAEAIFVTLMSLVNPGDEVILFKPYYPPYLSCVRMAGGKPVFVPVNEETLIPDPETLKDFVSEKTKAIIVNSPCNPTGMVYDKDTLKAVAEIAADNDLYVLTDEVYDRFIYDSNSFFSIASFDKNLERTIIINSFSKTYAMTGWRIGYLAGSKELVSNILKVKSAVNVCANAISQKAALEALKKSSDRYVKKMLAEYARRRKLVLNMLSKVSEFKYPKPNGAFYVFPDISALEKDSLKFTMYLLEKAHVVVSPGNAFGSDGHIRISYASSMKNLKTAMNRIVNAVKEYKA